NLSSKLLNDISERRVNARLWTAERQLILLLLSLESTDWLVMEEVPIQRDFCRKFRNRRRRIDQHPQRVCRARNVANRQVQREELAASALPCNRERERFFHPIRHVLVVNADRRLCALAQLIDSHKLPRIIDERPDLERKVIAHPAI